MVRRSLWGLVLCVISARSDTIGDEVGCLHQPMMYVKAIEVLFKWGD